MSPSEGRSTTHETFPQRLEELRWRMDLLPHEQRPHLHISGGAAEKQYRHGRHGRGWAFAIVETLRLINRS